MPLSYSVLLAQSGLFPRCHLVDPLGLNEVKDLFGSYCEILRYAQNDILSVTRYQFTIRKSYPQVRILQRSEGML